MFECRMLGNKCTLFEMFITRSWTVQKLIETLGGNSDGALGI